jgi:hypothetical protein
MIHLGLSGTVCSWSWEVKCRRQGDCITAGLGLIWGELCKKGNLRVDCSIHFEECSLMLTTEARDRFAAAIYDFVTGVRISQATWARGISTLEDYTARRLRTVGTNPCVAVMQWAYGLTLPQSVWNHEAMVSITCEVAISDFLWNDIVSLRKEIDDGDIDSAIPVMVWNEECSAQTAVDQCVRLVEKSWERLLEAEKRLLEAHAGESEQMRSELRTLIGGCKDVIVGHMVYSLKIPRNMSAARMGEKDCSFRIVL